MNDPYFDQLQTLYHAHGFQLFIVGGTTRDLLLGRPFSDRDFVSDATPEQEKLFLPDASYVFAKYGSIRYVLNGQEIDITTLREEKDYQDFRHPGKIVFVKEPRLDYSRRDFTINGLYLTKDYRVLDFGTGLADLKAKLIRFIGEPEKRVQEDPLRILRAERFRDSLSFTIEKESQAAIDKYRFLLAKLNPEKIKEEERKGWKRIK
jgi:tRNA nucleotidyltransferase (CCA-adding enzyme)